MRALMQFNQFNMFNQDPSFYVDLIIHLTPLEIADSRKYKAWMNTFDRKTVHLLTYNKVDSNPLSTFSTFDKIYNKLNRNYSRMFPSLSYSSVNSGTLKDFDFSVNVTTGVPSLRYIFRPSRSAGFEKIEAVSIRESSEKLRTKQTEAKVDSLNQQNDFEVVFLGTGSRVSSVLRNTSGILLNLR